MRPAPPALVLLLLAAWSGSTRAEALDLRGVPGAVELWRWEGSAQSLLSGSELLFVAGKGRVSAIDPRDGELMWTTVIGSEEEDCGCGHGAHVQVDDRLFVPIADAVAVVDTDDGGLVTRVRIGGTVTRVLGPPVIAQGRGEGGSTIVRFDERSGEEVARLEVGEVQELERLGDRFVLLTSGPYEPRRRERANVALGLDADLQVAWRRELEGPWQLEREGDRLFAVEWQHDGGARHALAVEDGALGPAEATADERDDRQRGESTLACGDGTDAAAVTLRIARAGEPAVGRGRSSAVVTRRGEGGWSTEVPGWPAHCTRWGEHLLLRLGQGTTRDLLAVLRARSGARENLLHLPPAVTGVLVAGGRVVLETGEALIGTDPLDSGPSERELRTLAESVAALLAGGDRAMELGAELAALGPEALPIAVEVMPGLAGEALLAVAELAAEAGYQPAAGPLAAVLDRLAGDSAPVAVRQRRHAASPAERNRRREQEERHWHEDRLAAALAAVAGPAQTPTLARYVGPQWPHSCAGTLAALGRLGTPEALAVWDRALSTARPEEPWFRAPRPSSQGARSAAAAAADWQRAVAAEDYDAMEALLLAVRSARVELDGRSADGVSTLEGLVVFPASDYGGEGDLWVAEPGEEGPRVYFLGSMAACAMLAPRVDGDVLEVACAGASLPELWAALSGDELAPELAEGDEEVAETAPPPHTVLPLRVPIGRWRADADGDGLTDLLERRLGLDPSGTDTDGDGVADARDPAPNSRPSTDGGMAAAALAALWACRGGEGEPSGALFVVGAEGEWYGHRGPVFTLRGAGAEASALGYRLLQVDAGGDGAGPLARGERRLLVRWGMADDDPAEDPATGIVLGSVHGRWVVTRWEDGVPTSFRH